MRSRSSGLVLLAVCVVSVTCSRDRPVVDTNYGNVAGTTAINFDGTKYYAFRGIPYAKAPVGELRFERPVPPDAWSDVKDASKEGGVCIQKDYMTGETTGSEDCLFVNIYVPEAPETLHGNEKAVMVFIHGGGFFYGHGNGDIYGPGKLVDYDVILVTFNYRLGIFGFLSTGDDHLPGNYGMWDQVQALEWVQQNIKAFGGDPNKVTIFGESAGAGSASHHVFSPASKGLFRGAIFMSGNSLTPWGVQEDPMRNTRIVAVRLKCSTESSSEMEECLRKKSTDELFRSFTEFGKDEEEVAFDFGPVIDGYDDNGSFLPEHPEVMLKKKQYKNVPVMMGILEDEGAIIAVFNQRKYKFDKNFYDHELGKYVSKVTNGKSKNLSSATIKKMYFDKVTDFDDKSQTTKPLNKIISDALFDVSMVRMANAFAAHKSSKTYVYIITYRGKHSIMDGFSKEKNAPTHVDDIQYIFDTNLAGSDGKLEGKDKEVSRQILTLWTNFAKNGNPTPIGVSKNIISQDWESVSDGEYKYLEIGDELRMRKGFDADKIRFWESLEKPEEKMRTRNEEL